MGFTPQRSYPSYRISFAIGERKINIVDERASRKNVMPRVRSEGQNATRKYYATCCRSNYPPRLTAGIKLAVTTKSSTRSCWRAFPNGPGLRRQPARRDRFASQNVRTSTPPVFAAIMITYRVLLCCTYFFTLDARF